MATLPQGGLAARELGELQCARLVGIQQPGRFVKASLEDLFRRAGYEVLESYGFMLKPFSNAQMESLNLEWPVIDALFEIGKEYPDLATHLFVRASRDR